MWIIKVECLIEELNKNFKRKRRVGSFNSQYLYIKEKMKDMREFIKTTIREFLNENKHNNYKEIEFVCHNSDSDTSTDRKSQKDLYDDLKKLEINSGYKIKPYMQDFCEGSHIELSLAVIILDKQNEEYWENKIMKLAKKHNVDFDLYNQRDDYQVNSIIRGDYYDNMI